MIHEKKENKNQKANNKTVSCDAEHNRESLLQLFWWTLCTLWRWGLSSLCTAWSAISRLSLFRDVVIHNQNVWGWCNCKSDPGHPWTCWYFHHFEHLCRRNEGTEKGRIYRTWFLVHREVPEPGEPLNARHLLCIFYALQISFTPRTPFLHRLKQGVCRDA